MKNNKKQPVKTVKRSSEDILSLVEKVVIARNILLGVFFVILLGLFISNTARADSTTSCYTDPYGNTVCNTYGD